MRKFIFMSLALLCMQGNGVSGHPWGNDDKGDPRYQVVKGAQVGHFKLERDTHVPVSAYWDAMADCCRYLTFLGDMANLFFGH